MRGHEAGALGVATTVLVLAPLPLPPGHDLGAWVELHGPVTAAVALVRIAGVVYGAWLATTMVAVVAGRAAGAVRLAAAAERTLPAFARRAMGGLSVLSIVAVGPSAVAARAVQPDDGTATMAVLDEAEAPSVPDAPSPPPAPSPRTAPAAPSVSDEWTVAPGESFWSIAEAVLTEALGRAPTDREVDPYWRRTVAANRDRLVSGDPDVVHPGQVFVVPPLTS